MSVPMTELKKFKVGDKVKVSWVFSEHYRIESIELIERAKSIPRTGKENIPDGVHGFSGWISGQLVKKDVGTLHIRIKAIKKLWKGNKAEKPKNLIGKTIRVNEGWHKPKSKKKYEPNKWHVAFIKKAKLGKLDLDPSWFYF